MKKYFLLLLMTLMAVSCSRKVEIKGKVTGGSPLERIEIIEAAGVGTLPLLNMAVSKDGSFAGDFDAPRDGMYIITYGGNMNMIYLKGGQKLNISGNYLDFPASFVINGEAKANNDFLKAADTSFQTYATKIEVNKLLTMDEPKFIAEFNKIKGDMMKQIDDAASKYKADSSAKNWKKEDVTAKLFGLLDAYEQNHAMASGNPGYKPSEKFQDLKKSITKNNDRLIRDIPIYRNYMLNSLNADFQKFAQTKMQGKNPAQQPMVSEIFAEFLKTRKDLSQISKDYFLSYVMAQSDINFKNDKNYDKIAKLIDDNISDSELKSDLKKLQIVLMGYKAGDTPNLALVKKDGSKTNLGDLKGKPTMVMFYASWNPNISMMTIPVLKEMSDFYKSKLNFAYVNLDDTKEQFLKTSGSLLKGFPGEHYYVEGGINSKAAKDFGLYAFKLPGFVLIGSDGKFVGRPFFNLGEPELTEELQKLTGLKAPEVKTPFAPEVPKGETRAEQDKKIEESKEAKQK